VPKYFSAVYRSKFLSNCPEQRAGWLKADNSGKTLLFADLSLFA
jgi:hypothetical protein